MSALSNLEPALREAFLQAWPNADGATGFENVIFDPSGKETYFKFHYLPSRSVIASLGKSGQDNFPGVVQIDMFVPIGTGTTGTVEFETAMALRFTAGARCRYDTASLIIRNFYRNGPGEEDDGKWKFSYIINWESRVNRTN